MLLLNIKLMLSWFRNYYLSVYSRRRKIIRDLRLLIYFNYLISCLFLYNLWSKMLFLLKIILLLLLLLLL